MRFFYTFEIQLTKRAAQVSRDCAAFVGANADQLRGVGTLEDVSVALWLLALQALELLLFRFHDGGRI